MPRGNKKKQYKTYCHICGRFDFLSDEHYPPQCTFNKKNVIITQKLYDKNINKLYDNNIIKQGGLRDYVLCNKCNNYCGNYYIPDYKKIIDYLYDDTINNDISINPFLIIKQILSIFSSIHNRDFTIKHHGLSKFLQNKDDISFIKNIDIYMYLNNNIGFGKIIPVSSLIILDGNNVKHTICVSEFLFNKIGFILHFKDKSNFELKNIIDTSHLFKISNYIKCKNLSFNKNKLIIKNVVSPYPLDFRDKCSYEYDTLINYINDMRVNSKLDNTPLYFDDIPVIGSSNIRDNIIYILSNTSTLKII